MMKHDFKTYTILLVVLVLSFSSAYFIPANGLLQSTMAAPGIIALLSAIFQLVRDQALFEKQLEIQSRQFQFTLGAASHMANTAFDKHTKFCEEYMAEIIATAKTLFREGETESALPHAGKLFSLREQHATWLTEEINSKLAIFEAALRQLGASAHYINVTRGDPKCAEQRSIKIDKNFILFDQILGFGEQKEVEEEYAVEAIKRTVKDILGIEELTMLRAHLVKEASDILKKNV